MNTLLVYQSRWSVLYSRTTSVCQAYCHSRICEIWPPFYPLLIKSPRKRTLFSSVQHLKSAIMSLMVVNTVQSAADHSHLRALSTLIVLLASSYYLISLLSAWLTSPLQGRLRLDHPVTWAWQEWLSRFPCSEGLRQPITNSVLLSRPAWPST